jgi:amino acid permease
MIQQKIIQKTATLVFTVLPFLAAVAQEDEFQDDVQDVQAPAAPIDNYILIAVVIAIYLSYRFIKTQQINNKPQ